MAACVCISRGNGPEGCGLCNETGVHGGTYASGKPLPPENEWEPRIFVRADCFYIVNLPADDDLNNHAELNPGTVRIEDGDGSVLWSAQ